MNQESHLSSEQIESLLSHTPEPKWQLHVETCAACAAELAHMKALFGDLRQAATASAKHHRYLTPVRNRKVPAAAWAFAAGALAISIGTPLAVQHFRHPVMDETTMDLTDTPAKPQISDEALLSSVQDDLSASVPRSMQPLSGSSTTSSSQTRKD